MRVECGNRDQIRLQLTSARRWDSGIAGFMYERFRKCSITTLLSPQLRRRVQTLYSDFRFCFISHKWRPDSPEFDTVTSETTKFKTTESETAKSETTENPSQSLGGDLCGDLSETAAICFCPTSENTLRAVVGIWSELTELQFWGVCPNCAGLRFWRSLSCLSTNSINDRQTETKGNSI